MKGLQSYQPSNFVNDWTSPGIEPTPTACSGARAGRQTFSWDLQIWQLVTWQPFDLKTQYYLYGKILFIQILFLKQTLERALILTKKLRVVVLLAVISYDGLLSKSVTGRHTLSHSLHFDVFSQFFDGPNRMTIITLQRGRYIQFRRFSTCKRYNSKQITLRKQSSVYLV